MDDHAGPGAAAGRGCGHRPILDQSHLITDDDFGAPLFTDVAYRFMVNVYRGQVMCADVLARIRALLDAGKARAHAVPALHHRAALSRGLSEPRGY